MGSAKPRRSHRRTKKRELLPAFPHLEDERSAELLERVRLAYRGVSLGRGVGLTETEALDNRLSDRERLQLRDADEHHGWQALVLDPRLVETRGVGGPVFMDPESLRFHLPAYLCLALLRGSIADSYEVLDTGVFILTRREWEDGNRPTRFRLSDSSQRAYVAAVLRE